MTKETERAQREVGTARLELSWGSHTDVGNVRTLNEDSLLAAFPVFVVADGMGGHRSGEVASALAIGAMASLTELEHVDVREVIATVESANRVIVDRSDNGERSMGTTLTGIVATTSGHPATVTVLNVGDSRTYLFRGGALSQITIDHSHVQELIDEGLITPEEAVDHPERNVVTRALGIELPLDIDIMQVEVRTGDRFLICSDGLTGELSNVEIAELLAPIEPSAAAALLVEKILSGPARDNVSVIVVDIVRVAMGDVGETTSPRRKRPVPADPGETTSPNKRSERRIADPSSKKLIEVIPAGQPPPTISPAMDVDLEALVESEWSVISSIPPLVGTSEAVPVPSYLEPDAAEDTDASVEDSRPSLAGTHAKIVDGADTGDAARVKGTSDE